MGRHPESDQEAERLLEKGAASLGIHPSSKQLDQFSRYLDELMRWNRSVNLTGSRSAHEVVINHMLDSIAGLTVLGIVAASPARVVDIGTGAGFPGLPLKLCRPEWSVTLIEATKKKVAFLHHIVGILGLERVEIVAERAESLTQDPHHTGGYDLAVTRAVGSPAYIAGLARPLLSLGGRLLLYLGPTGTEKAAASPPPGYQVASLKRFVLPFTNAKRTLLLLERA